MDAGELIEQAQELVAAGELGRAEALVDGAVLQSTDNPRVLIRSAEIKQRLGNPGAAVDLYLRAARIYEKDNFIARTAALMATSVRLKGDDAYIRLEAARIGVASGDLKAAHANRVAVVELWRPIVPNVAGLARKQLQVATKHSNSVSGFGLQLSMVLNDLRLDALEREILAKSFESAEQRHEGAAIEVAARWLECAREQARISLQELEFGDRLIERLASEVHLSDLTQLTVGLLQRALVTNPDHPELLDRLVVNLQETGFSDLAVPTIERLIQEIARGGSRQLAIALDERLSDLSKLKAPKASSPRRIAHEAPPPVVAPLSIDATGNVHRGTRQAVVSPLSAAEPVAHISNPRIPEAIVRGLLKKTREPTVAVPLPPEPSDSQVTDQRLLRSLPTPIARDWDRVVAITRASELPIAVSRVANTTLRFLLAVAIVDYVRGRRDQELELSLPELTRPTEGTLVEVLRRVLKHLTTRGEVVFAPEIHRTFLDSNFKPTETFEALNDFVVGRNKAFHDLPVGSSLEARGQALVRAMRQVLLKVEWLRDYSLAQIVDAQLAGTGEHAGTLRRYRGKADLGETVSLRWRGDLQRRMVYLFNPTTSLALDLTPFLSTALVAGFDEERLFLWKHVESKTDQVVLRADGVSREELGAFPGTSTGTFTEWLARTDHGSECATVQVPTGAAGLGPRRGTAPQKPVSGRFEIRGLIAEGGMATVHEAWDAETGSEVALKIINVESSDDPSLRERFHREIKIMRALRHPNILEILDDDQLDDQRLFIVMPLLRDGSLADALAQGKQPLPLLIKWASELMTALSYIHAEGFVHRDIKPENLLRRGERLVLADFGIALREDDTNQRLTKTLQQIGTRLFMSPEQHVGEDGTPKSDIFSAAVVFHMLTTGQKERPAVAGRRIDGRWGELLRAMGSPDPDDRPDAVAALELLKACAQEHPFVG